MRKAIASSIELAVQSDDDQANASARGEIRTDRSSNEARRLCPNGQPGWRSVGPSSERNAGWGTHDAGMSAVSTAADGHQLLRSGQRKRGRGGQQCPKNAQQDECRNPPHGVSVHASSGPRRATLCGIKHRCDYPETIAAAIEAGETVIASSARAARALRRLHARVATKAGPGSLAIAGHRGLG